MAQRGNFSGIYRKVQLKPLKWDDLVVRVIVIQKTLIEHAEKLRQVKAVLEEGGNFSGIYRVQLKPLKLDGEGEE
ncbi:hypothetical protein F2Q69_00032987 [Brassica cretica]|uniref:Uncharacterized protein n=1 Tax=Brassica cretica TaxID=69181 RepID=A0A8S9SHR4_BRACR|nr:hypothetical protein F2Q69_00032987 [Brassica cretica]